MESTVEIPETIELCVRERNRSLCLGVIHRMAPDGRIYCTRCGGTAAGVTYTRQSGYSRPSA